MWWCVPRGPMDRTSVWPRRPKEQMKKTDKNQKPIAAKKISSFDELQTLLAPLVECEFEIDGVVVSVPVQRVEPSIAERKRVLETAAQPPFDEKRKDWNPLDKKYMEEAAMNKRKARALVLYTCVPLIAAKKPGLTNEDEMLKFIEQGGANGRGIFTENILERLAVTAEWGGVNSRTRVNFISPGGSED